jgi:rhodanese-related sulfurtransferase
MTTKTAAQLVQEAKAQLENLSPQQVASDLAKGNVLLVDIREPDEREQNGFIEGAVSAPRGMLEFYADPTSPYHRQELDPQKRVILQCASGGRSALAAMTLKQLGYSNVAHLDGGLKAWTEAGQKVSKHS